MIHLMHTDQGAARALLDDALLTCEAWRLVDAIVAQGDDWLEARWTADADGPWYRGDGQGRQLLLPGTVLAEHAVQSGEALIYSLRGRPEDDGVPVLGGFDRMRCRSMVRPGETLLTRVQLRQQIGPVYVVDATVRRHQPGNPRALTASITFTATDAVRRLD